VYRNIEPVDEEGYLKYSYSYRLYVDSGVSVTYDRPQGEQLPLDGTVFEDVNFEKCLVEYDRNGDGALSEAEVAAVTELYVSSKNIASLKGIERFTRLVDLDCASNQLTTLDLSANTALETLSCDSNQLTTLDLSANTALEYLYCASNQLTTLKFHPDNLSYLDCSDNRLTALSLDGCVNLQRLYCEDNRLQALDFRQSPKLLLYYTDDQRSEENGHVDYGDSVRCDAGVRLNNGLKHLTAFDMPDDLRTIEAEAFVGTGFVYVDLTGVSRIESKAFANCADLRVVTLYTGVNYIADDAFSGCPNVAFVTGYGESDYGYRWARAHGFPVTYER
jgi:hypothetical protein